MNASSPKNTRRPPGVDARLRELFKKDLTGKEASLIIEREFSYRICGHAVCHTWRMMGLHRGRRPPPEFRGRLPAPKNALPLVRQFIGALNEQKTTFSEVAARAGLMRRTLGRWGRKCDPQLSNFEAALNVLDLELCIRPRKVPA